MRVQTVNLNVHIKEFLKPTNFRLYVIGGTGEIIEEQLITPAVSTGLYIVDLTVKFPKPKQRYLIKWDYLID